VAAGVGEGASVGVVSLHELNKKPDKTSSIPKVNWRLLVNNTGKAPLNYHKGILLHSTTLLTNN
jgi:hypothetical protein